MTARRIRAAVLLLLCAATVLFALADEKRPSKIEIRAGDRIFSDRAVEKDALRVLFVGNSLTYWNEMPWLVERIAAARPTPKLATAFVGGSGMSLRQQWERGRAVRAIRESRWDYVVLQGQSNEPDTRHDEFFRYARLLDREIRSRGAKTVFFLTWAAHGKPQSSISEPYLAIARELGAIVAPVGIAVEELRREGRQLLDASALHPNLAGAYLAACVFYATITGRSPVGLPHEFDVRFEIEEVYRAGLETEKIPAADALRIQRAAWAAVSAARREFAPAGTLRR